MEIRNGSIPPSLVNEVQDPQKAPGRVSRPDVDKAAESGSGGAREGRVSLSEKARQMLAVRHAVDAAPDIRTSKVAELSSRLASGIYQVSRHDVARSLVRNALFEAVA